MKAKDWWVVSAFHFPSLKVSNNFSCPSVLFCLIFLPNNFQLSEPLTAQFGPFLYSWSCQTKNFSNSAELTSYKQRFRIFFLFKNGIFFNVAIIQEINVATVKYLLNRKMIYVSKNCFRHTYFLTCSHLPQRHRAHPGALAGSWLRWDQGCQMPGSHRISSVASYKFWKRSFAILVTTVWSLCLEISLTSWPESPSAGGCPVNFFPHFGCLSSPSLPSCWEGGLAHRMCCDLAAIPLLSEHSFFSPKESST